MNAEADKNSRLSSSMNEVCAALMNMQSGRAPGIDGLPVDFHKLFWPVGKDPITGP